MKKVFANFFSGQTKHGAVGEWTVPTEVSVTVGERGWLAGYKAAGSLSLSQALAVAGSTSMHGGVPFNGCFRLQAWQCPLPSGIPKRVPQ